MRSSGQDPEKASATSAPACEDWCAGHNQVWSHKCNWVSASCTSCSQCLESAADSNDCGLQGIAAPIAGGTACCPFSCVATAELWTQAANREMTNPSHGRGCAVRKQSKRMRSHVPTPPLHALHAVELPPRWRAIQPSRKTPFHPAPSLPLIPSPPLAGARLAKFPAYSCRRSRMDEPCLGNGPADAPETQE